MEENPFYIPLPDNIESTLRGIEDKPFTPEKHSPYPVGTAENKTQELIDLTKVNDEKNLKQLSDISFQRATSKKDKMASSYANANLFERFNGREVSIQDLGTDPRQVEYKYARTQGFLERSMNDLKVAGANFGSMFIATYLTLPELFSSVKTGEAANTDAMDAMYKWREGVENNNANFATEVDDQTGTFNTIKNVLLPGFMTGSSQGWGELFKSSAYGLGVGAALLTQEMLATAIAPGIGNSAVLANFVGRTLNSAKNLSRMTKIGEAVLGASKGINTMRNSIIAGRNIAAGTKLVYGMLMSGTGEAAFESLETRHHLKEQMIEDYVHKNRKQPDAEELKHIDAVVNDAANARFVANLALLSLSNTYQLGRLFKRFDVAKETTREIERSGFKATIDAAGAPVAKSILDNSKWYNKTFLKAVRKKGGSLAWEANSEGMEEFAQGVFESTTNSLYKYKLDHRGEIDMLDIINATEVGLKDNFNIQGLRSYLSGAAGGMGQQGGFELMGRTYDFAKGNKPQDTEQIKEDALNESIAYAKNFSLEKIVASFNINSLRGTMRDKIRSANAAAVVELEAKESLKTGDVKHYKDVNTLDFFNMIEAYASKGHSALLKEQFAFHLNAFEGDVKELFKRDITKEQAIQKFNTEVDKITNSFSKTQRAFVSPFPEGSKADDYFQTKWIPEIAYLSYRVNNLKDRHQQLETELGPIYDELKFLVGETNIGEGISHITKRIEELELAGTDSNLKESYEKSLALLTQLRDEIDSGTSSQEKLNTILIDFVTEYDDVSRKYLIAPYTDVTDIMDTLEKVNDTELIATDIVNLNNTLQGYFKLDAFAAFMDRYDKTHFEEIKKGEAAAKVAAKGGPEAVAAAVADVAKETKGKVPEEEIKKAVVNSETMEEAKEEIQKIADIVEVNEKLRKEKITFVNNEFIKHGLVNEIDKFLEENEFVLDDSDVEMDAMKDIVDDFIENHEFKEENNVRKSDDSEEQQEMQEAQEEIAILENVEENYLLSKFENRAYQPDLYDEKGEVKPEIIENHDTVKEYQESIRDTIHAFIEDAIDNKKMSEEQLIEYIVENSTIYSFTVDPAKVDANTKLIHMPASDTALPIELVLYTTTTDALTVVFEKDGQKLIIQTFKEPVTSLKTMNAKDMTATLELNDISVAPLMKKQINAVMGEEGISYVKFLTRTLFHEDAKSVYDFLESNGLIPYGATPDSQLNLLAERQARWEKLKALSNQPLKGKLTFDRHHSGFKSDPESVVDISEIAQPYMQITDLETGITTNEYVFFYYDSEAETDEDKITFVTAQPKHGPTLIASIIQSFEAKSPKQPSEDSYSGYYMVVNDSTEKKNPYTIRLRVKEDTVENLVRNLVDNKPGSAEGEIDSIKLIDENFNGIEILVSRSEVEGKSWNRSIQLEFRYTDENDNEYRFYTKSFKVDNLSATLKNYNKEGKDLVLVSKEDSNVKKIFDNVDFNIVPVKNTRLKPSTDQEIIDTREAVGVRKENFLVSKFKPIFEAQEEPEVTDIPAVLTNKPETAPESKPASIATSVPTSSTQSVKPKELDHISEQSISESIGNIIANTGYQNAEHIREMIINAAISHRNKVAAPVKSVFQLDINVDFDVVKEWLDAKYGTLPLPAANGATRAVYKGEANAKSKLFTNDAPAKPSTPATRVDDNFDDDLNNLINLCTK